MSENSIKRQFTDWGYIDWLNPEKNGENKSLNVGIVSIAPHGHMNPHIHFTEQVLYTLQGDGYSLVNGEKIDMSSPGKMYHWEASVIHEMYNEGDMEFKHLMVSCPDPVELDPLNLNACEGEPLDPGEADEYLRAAIEGTCEQFSDNLHYSYVIFDASGMPIKKTHVFPEFCCRHCENDLSAEKAVCMKHYIPCPFNEETEFECPHGVTVFIVPVLYRGNFLGYVQGGYVHTHHTEEEGIYVMPHSSVKGARVLLRRIVKAMENYCEFHQFKNQLLESEMALADTRQYQEVLIANLRNAERTMTDLKINNHFLFNTLNQMASMALEGGMLSLYQSILDLSRLFSYAIRNESNLVPLSKEFEYLDSYLKLQKLRYGERLHLEYMIQTELSEWEIPFNFLMPMAENAFTHGFFQEEEKYFTLEIREKTGMLLFLMKNNGKNVEPETCIKMKKNMMGSSAHGLSMIYRKLRAVYGDQFSIDFFPGKRNGIEITVLLPAKKVRGREKDDTSSYL